MHLSLMDTVLWGTGFVANSVLLLVLIRCRRWRLIPWFTAWIGYQVLATVMLYGGLRWGSREVYAGLYWSGALIDFVLQIALVIEVARIVLRVHGEWAEGARARFYGAGAAGALFAGLMAWWIAPTTPGSMDMWERRGTLFSTMLICCTFTGVMLASQGLGLVWRGHVMRLGYGLIAWSFAAFAIDTLHSYWGDVTYFTALEHTRQWVYVGAVMYWAVTLWLPERPPREISPAMGADLIQIQANGTALSRRDSRP